MMKKNIYLIILFSAIMSSILANYRIEVLPRPDDQSQQSRAKIYSATTESNSTIQNKGNHSIENNILKLNVEILQQLKKNEERLKEQHDMIMAMHKQCDLHVKRKQGRLKIVR